MKKVKDIRQNIWINKKEIKSFNNINLIIAQIIKMKH